MPVFKLGVVRTRILELTYQDEVEAADIHEAAKILRERAEGEIPNDDDLIDDLTRIIAWDGVGLAHDVN
jgi:hypothetical protein